MRLEWRVCYHKRVRVFGDSNHDLKSLVIATSQLNSITAQLCVSCKTHLGTGKQVCCQQPRLNAGPLANVWMQHPPQKRLTAACCASSGIWSLSSASRGLASGGTNPVSVPHKGKGGCLRVIAGAQTLQAAVFDAQQIRQLLLYSTRTVRVRLSPHGMQVQPVACPEQCISDCVAGRECM